MDKARVESYTAALVREHLTRHRCTETLAALNRERPTPENEPCRTRKALMEDLKLNRVIMHNMKRPGDDKLESFLELITERLCYMKRQLQAPDYGVVRTAPPWPTLATVAEPKQLPGLQFNTVPIDFKEVGLKYTTSSFEVNLASELLGGLVSKMPGVSEWGGACVESRLKTRLLHPS